MQKEGIEACFIKKTQNHKQYTCNFGVAKLRIATDTVYTDTLSDIQYQ